jgi:predicted neuraminidase
MPYLKIILQVFASTMLVFSSKAQDWKISSSELIIAGSPVKEYHASSIVELTAGKLLVAFFGGSQEGVSDVDIWVAQFSDGKWLLPHVVATGKAGDTVRYPCWNPVLFRNKFGELSLYYKVGPNPASWWGMVITSADNGATWTKPVRLVEPVLGPIKNKPVQLAGGTIISPSSTEKDGNWKVHIERSTDNGKSWEVIPVDAATPFKVIQPTVLIYPENNLQILCRSDQDSIVESWSRDNGKTWSKLEKTNLLNPNSGIDGVTLKSGSQLLVYNPTKRGKEWFNNRGRLSVAQSSDGIHWQDIVMLEDSSDKEFSYPAIIQAADGTVHISYTYNRTNIRHVVLTATR